MKKEDLLHWQDTPEEVQKCGEVFEKFKAAGLLEELAFIIDKRMTNAGSDEAYRNENFAE